MSPKSAFISLYLLVWVIFTSISWHFGYPASAHRGFFYVLGNSLFWPFSGNFYLIFRIIASIIVFGFPLYILSKQKTDSSND